jgi:hypothetical protein
VTRSVLAVVLAVSLEVYSPLEDAHFRSGEAVENVAQSLTSAKVVAASVQHIDK